MDGDGDEDDDAPAAAAAAARCFAGGFVYPIGALPPTGAPAPGGVGDERARTELPIVLPSVAAVASERHDELAGGPRECGEGKGEVIISTDSGFLAGAVRMYGRVWCQRRCCSADMGGARRTKDSGCYIPMSAHSFSLEREETYTILYLMLSVVYV